MVFDGRTYSMLVVSPSDKFNTSLRTLLAATEYAPVTYVSSIASAKRERLERSYDFVLINAPLPDDFGSRFAIDVSADKSTVCLLLVKSELHEELRAKVVGQGVFTLPRPVSGQMLLQALGWLAAARERLRNLEAKTTTIEEKMEEIRLVNRAKWLLIESLKMTEADAHRYIEKQAMDRCATRREIAENVIKTYT